MPNWSNTNITFFSKNKEQLEKLFKDIRDCPHVYKEELEEDFNKLKEQEPSFHPIGEEWIGTLLYKLGMITKEQIINDTIPDYLSCRGRFLNDGYWEDELLADETPNPYLDDETGWFFTIQTEDAWQPFVDTWDQILMEHYPDVSFVYISEEPGNGYYCNSDECRYYFVEDYLIDLTIDPETVPESIRSQLKCNEYVSYYQGISFNDLKNLMQVTFTGFEDIETPEELEYKIDALSEQLDFESEEEDVNWIRLHKYEE